jgi:hypothetical protein
MTPSDLILAAILLTTPPGVPEPQPTADHWPALRDAVHQVAVEWEILDARETSYLFIKIEEFDADLTILRRRYQDLHDAPKLADSFRLPDRKQVLELVRFNRAFRKNLETRQQIEFDRADDLYEVIKETDRLYQTWDAVRDAKCEFLYIPARRQALKKLRDLIGEEAYAKGDLPPNIPTWRFQEK